MPEALPSPEGSPRPKGLHALRSLTHGRGKQPQRNKSEMSAPSNPACGKPYGVHADPRNERADP